MMLGVREGFLKVYECERALMRECQRHLREDAHNMATLSEVKHGLKQDLAILQGKVRNFKADEWRSPHDELTNMNNKIERVEWDLQQAELLTAAPPGNLPHGLVCRLALRLEGGEAAEHISLDRCSFPHCYQTSRLAALMSEHASSG